MLLEIIGQVDISKCDNTSTYVFNAMSWETAGAEDGGEDIGVENGSDDFLTKSVKTGCQLVGNVDSWISKNELNNSGHSSCSSFNLLGCCDIMSPPTTSFNNV
ncbi:Hypothetical predicted protein [Paramuricea clavata]|uniref:Uncharacterized protein n=1 Tax=Paramuricea clavata TaxID=317549 RepID=A0A6S7GCI3_PARCT|nr:Hypothetical predicted protein [Paramuricea clavata]